MKPRRQEKYLNKHYESFDTQHKHNFISRYPNVDKHHDLLALRALEVHEEMRSIIKDGKWTNNIFPIGNPNELRSINSF